MRSSRVSALDGLRGLAVAAVLLFHSQLHFARGGYVGNWRFYFSGQNYAELFRAPSPVLHFWSLAIEEQFYVVFPLVVAFVAWAARGRRQVLGAVLGAGIVASVLADRALYRSVGS